MRCLCPLPTIPRHRPQSVSLLSSMSTMCYHVHRDTMFGKGELTVFAGRWSAGGRGGDRAEDVDVPSLSVHLYNGK